MADEPSLPRTAAGSHAYDTLYAADDIEARREKRYRRLFRRVADIAAAKSLPSVLEVGCGSGTLAQMLIAERISYTGFDFNRLAVERAKRRNGDDRHFFGDATDPASYTASYDGIVCCEVLEHIENDLEAVDLWKPGALCICSVPNFDDETHVRLFRHENEVRERYGRLIDIEWIERRPVSPIAGSTPREYLRRLRWSRNDPKRFRGCSASTGSSGSTAGFCLSGRGNDPRACPRIGRDRPKDRGSVEHLCCTIDIFTSFAIKLIGAFSPPIRPSTSASSRSRSTVLVALRRKSPSPLFSSNATGAILSSGRGVGLRDFNVAPPSGDHLPPASNFHRLCGRCRRTTPGCPDWQP